MKVALFGRTGFIGSNVAGILRHRHIPFVGVSRTISSSDTIAINWMNAQSLDKIPADITAAIICSSKLPQTSYQASDIRDFITSNVLGLLNILEWAKRRKVSRVVYCSTLSMIPKSTDGPGLIDTQSHYPYKISKAAAEHLLTGYCCENGIDHMILRIASVYGPGMKPDVVHAMIHAAKSGSTFILKDRSTEADFVHVNDVALAAVESLNVQPANAVINVTSGEPVKLIDLWKLVKDIAGIQQASVEIKGDNATTSSVYSATDFKRLINRPLIDLETGIRDLINTYR
jgi:nucleoside-diphosphate-sugar epimerase